MQIRSHEVGRHVINSKGTLSDPKKLKVLNFPKPMLHRHIEVLSGSLIISVTMFLTFQPVYPLQKMIGYKKSNLQWSPALETTSKQ
jgi:hypothetical protein